MAVTDKDIQEIHTKLGTIFDKLDDVYWRLGDLNRDVEVIKAHCQDCSKIVLGNGNKSVDARLTQLETKSAYQSKWFWLAMTMTGTGMAGLVGSVVTLVVSRM